MPKANFNAFKLKPGKLTIVDAELTDYYKACDAMFQGWFGGGSQPHRDTRMAEMKKLSNAGMK